MALRSGIQKNYVRFLSSGLSRQGFSPAAVLGTNPFSTMTTSLSSLVMNNSNKKNNHDSIRLMKVASFSTNDKDEDAIECFRDGKPTLEYVTAIMPRSYAAMKHEQIIQLSAEGIKDAIIEQLVRNIMAVDQIEYDDAQVVFAQIKEKNMIGHSLYVLPYVGGLGMAVIFGVGSNVLVFMKNPVLWFNEKYVTMEVPHSSELDTWLEVGSWSWNWMEPAIGQLSFMLLCMQLGRAQISNMGLRPYSRYIRDRRGANLAKLFPRYDSTILKTYSKSVPFF